MLICALCIKAERTKLTKKIFNKMHIMLKFQKNKILAYFFLRATDDMSVS